MISTVTLEDKHKPLLELVDVVKVDLMRLDQAGLWQAVRALKQWPVKLLAEKVDSEGLIRHCHDLGFDLFQGYYFAKPAIITGKKLSHSEMALIRLLGLLLEDAETVALEGVFKHEPGLSLNLMRLTNSAAAGGSVTSPLLQLAATRGRLMELLGALLARHNRELEDHAFMTGIMSLMPTLLHIPMGEILGQLPVCAQVREALEARAGTLGRLLALVEKLEESDPLACHELIKRLPGLGVESVNASLARALAWANSIGRESA